MNSKTKKASYIKYYQLQYKWIPKQIWTNFSKTSNTCSDLPNKPKQSFSITRKYDTVEKMVFQCGTSVVVQSDAERSNDMVVVESCGSKVVGVLVWIAPATLVMKPWVEDDVGNQLHYLLAFSDDCAMDKDCISQGK